MRTVVIAGGRGQLGSVLRKSLIKSGYSPLVVTRDLDPQKKYHFITWDELQQFGLPESTEHVVNLAGACIFDIWKPWTSKYKNEVRESRLWSNTTLRDIIAQSHVKPLSFLTTSHVAIYGGSPGDTAQESTQPNPSTYLGQCALEWEQAARLGAKEAEHTRQIFLRSGFVIGETSTNTDYALWPAILDLLGRYHVSRPDLLFPWIYTKDWASIIMTALENPTISGPVNAAVTSPLQDAVRVMRNRDRAVINATGKVLPLILAPDRRSALTVRYSVDSPVLRSAGHKKLFPSHAHLKKYVETITMEPDVFYPMIIVCIFACVAVVFSMAGPGDRGVII